MGGAKDDRTGKPATGTRAHAAGVIGKIVEHRVDEADELDLAYGFEALGGHADGEPTDRRLVKRRIDDTLAAETLIEALRRAEHAAMDADVLPEEHDIGVVREGA